jgi:solute:Na+ symporter, SSS family
MTTGALTVIDWIVVIGYFAGMVVLGLRFGKRQTSSARYFLGSGRMPGWAIGMSMFATVISSWAFLALPAKAFQSDLQSLLTISTLPIAAWIAVRWFVPLFRERIQLSAYEYLERRFGMPARVYGNLAFLIVHFGKMAGILYLLCLAMAEMTGANIFVLIAVVGLSTVIYTFFGGMEGVVWTDVAQGSLLLFAGFVSAGFLLFGSPGGPEAVLQTAWDAEKFKLASSGFSWARAGTVVFVFFGLTFYTQKYLSDQTIVQRYLVAGSRPQAGKAIWMSSLLVMLVWVLFMGVGVLLWAHYRLQPETMPPGLLATPDKIFPHFIGHGLPAGISGLILAGLLAATMSTLSSDLNCLSAVVFDDYYRKLRPASGDTAHLFFSRGVVLVSGVLGILLAMAMTRIHSMADAAFDFVSLVGGGVMGMYLLGMVTRCSARGLYVGLGCGVTFILWTYFCGPGTTAVPGVPRSPFHTLWVGTIGNLVVFGCGYLASRALRRVLPTPANS